jgi:hypothetical protein
MILTGENRRTRTKTFPVPLCSPQIPHGLTRTRTGVSLRWYMFMEPRWNDTDRGNRRNRRKIFPSATVHHKSHMDWPGRETGSPQWEAGDLPTRARHGLKRNKLISKTIIIFNKPSDKCWCSWIGWTDAVKKRGSSEQQNRALPETAVTSNHIFAAPWAFTCCGNKTSL